MNTTTPTKAVVDINDLLPSEDERDSSEESFRVLIGHQFGHPKLTLNLALQSVIRRCQVANAETIKTRPGLFQDENDLADELISGHLPEVKQRELTPSHARGLAYFTLQGCFYAVERHVKRKGIKLPEAFEEIIARIGRLEFAELAPFVGNLRGMPRIDKENGWLWLMIGDIIWTIDGQHRLVGMKILEEFLSEIIETRKYRKAGFYFPEDGHEEVSAPELRVWQMVYQEFCSTQVQVQLNLNLSADEEGYSFHFLNNFQKPVNRELSYSLDKSNPVNVFSGELLEKHEYLRSKLQRKEAVAINSLLFTKRNNMKGARPSDVKDRQDLAYKFWETILQIPGVLEKDSVARPVMLKALASITYVLHKSGDLANLETLFSEIPKFDFSHVNPLWRYYTLSAKEREKHGLNGLETYLAPEEDGTVRTVGIFKADANGKGGRMHWSMQHNTVVPILEDMIRWKLELPPRKHQKRVKTLKVED